MGDNITQALRAARAFLQTDRTALADAHMNPATNTLDADGAAAVAEFDEVLGQIDVALAAQEQAEPIYQLRGGDGRWIDQSKASYDYNFKRCAAEVRIVYAHEPAAQQQTAPVWIRPDDLAKARIAPHLCRVSPAQAHDFVPLHACQPAAQPVAVPAGWKLVPVEPTAEMLGAIVTSLDEHLLGDDAEKQYREDWAAMLAAAPAAPAQAQPLTDERVARMMPLPCVSKLNIERWDRAALHAFARAIERAHGIGQPAGKGGSL